ncbi:MAG: GNAT family N-acetyltransferase, partial [Actinomycetes bacterium]
FIGEAGGWVYYARPRLGGDGPFDAAAVASATARLAALGLPEVVEWVHETTPALLGAVQAEGSLQIEEIPLLVLDGDLSSGAPEVPPDVTVRLLTPADADQVVAARAVADVSFAAAGTELGAAGPAERDAARRPAEQRDLDLLAEGALRVAVAESEREGVLATGRTMPVDGVTEVGGVATLPAARRQGLEAAVTAALVDDAAAIGVSTVFLTASSGDVARVYERVGFRRVATGYAAERAS